MSITGLASSPGTAVLPTWWMPPVSHVPIAAARSSRSRSKRAGQSGSCRTTRIGSPADGIPPLLDGQRAFHPGLAVARDRAEEGIGAGFQIDVGDRLAVADDFGAADLLAGGIFDVDVVADRLRVVEFDRHLAGFARGRVARVGEVGALRSFEADRLRDRGFSGATALTAGFR